MTKAHMLAVAEPLQAGQDYTALCGALVKKAEFVMFVDRMFAGHCQVNSFHFCRQCWMQPTTERYQYGLVDGQATKEREETA